MQTVNILLQRGISRRRIVLRAGELAGLPTQFLLLFEDRARAKGISALQRDRMIQEMKDTHYSYTTGSRTVSREVTTQAPLFSFRLRSPGVLTADPTADVYEAL